MNNSLDALPIELTPGHSQNWSTAELYQRTLALINQRALIEFLQWARASEKTLEGVPFQVGVQNVTNNYKWFPMQQSPSLLEEGKASKNSAPHACLNELTKMMNTWRNGPEEEFAKVLYEMMSRADWDLKAIPEILPKVAARSFEKGDEWLRRYWAQETAEQIQGKTIPAQASAPRPRM